MTNEHGVFTYDLFHGTDSKYLDSILKNGFKCNPGPQDWLGHGVYFFTDGITCPHKNAVEWAVNKYYSTDVQSISVIQTKLTVKKEKILDLTKLSGLKKFNAARNIVIYDSKENLLSRRNLSIKKRKDFRIDDQVIMNMVIARLKVDVVISNLYIKDRVQRGLQLESCLPNSTVVSVINCEALDLSEAKEVSKYCLLDEIL